MPDDIKDTGTSTDATDPIKNLKGEFNRKLEKTTSQIDELKKLTEQLLSRTPAPKAANPEDDLESLYYSDPKEYGRRIKEQAKDEIKQELGSENALRSKATQVLSQLAADYPELNDANSAFYKRANEIYSNMDNEDKRSPMAYKVAVKDAAEELNMKPKSKRDPEDEEFIGSSGSSPARRPGKKKDGGLTEPMKMWAEALGVDLDDKDTADRVAKRAERAGRGWSNPEKPLRIRKGK